MSGTPIGFDRVMVVLLVALSLASIETSANSTEGLNASRFATHADRSTTSESSSARVSIRGIARLADGAPARRAVVISSAGGRAVTSDDGSFVLEIDFAPGADELGVTVVATEGATSRLASRRVGIAESSRDIDLGIVMLQSSGGCEAQWLPDFGPQPGTGGTVRCIAAYDDGAGSGPCIYIGGTMTTAGGIGVNRIAKWDGTSWSTVGGGVTASGVTPEVNALAVYDDGTGPALYAGGIFHDAGRATSNNIARWNGSEWSNVGQGTAGTVNTMLVFDEGLGSGPSLFVAGEFTSIGVLQAKKIARWNGAGWSTLGVGTTGFIHALGAYDDGSGPALYAGGTLLEAGGAPAKRIAKWDGRAWSAVGGGIDNGEVRALLAHDDGSGAGPSLIVGGTFTTIAGSPMNRVAKWNGTEWSTLGGGMSDGTVRAFIVHDDGQGGGAALLAGGSFTSAGGMPAEGVARWDGRAWSAAPINAASTYAFLAHDDGSALASGLYIVGAFNECCGATTNGVVRWTGSECLPIGAGLDDRVQSLVFGAIDPWGVPTLFAAGRFRSAGGVVLNGVARRNESGWEALGDGVPLVSERNVYALAIFDDGRGDGPMLFAGGDFVEIGGVVVNRIAKWDGRSWSSLAGGVADPGNAAVRALLVFDDGSGPALFAGGVFTSAGGVPANRVAKWTGDAWQPLGSGTNNNVFALAALDDGSGSALYAGGTFTSAGGVSASRVARWNGANWSALGNGVNSTVFALARHQEPGAVHPVLVAGGNLTSAGTVPASRIAKWNGASWSSLGGGVDQTVNALQSFAEQPGGDAVLVAGGLFTSAGGVAVRGIAKWDGFLWSDMEAGMTEQPFPIVHAFAVEAIASDSPPALIVGGQFPTSPSGDSFIARWQACEVPPCVEADLDCDGVVDGNDLGTLLGQWGACPECSADFNGDGVVDGDDLGALLGAWS